MDRSFLIEVKNKLTVEEIKKFEKDLRENIIKCIDHERKRNEKFDKRLYEVEMDMFKVIAKDLYFYFENGSEMLSKLSKSFWLYSFLMDIDKRLEEFNLGISDFKEMREEKDLNLGISYFKDMRRDDMRSDDMRRDDMRRDDRRRDDRRRDERRDDKRRDEFN